MRKIGLFFLVNMFVVTLSAVNINSATAEELITVSKIKLDKTSYSTNNQFLMHLSVDAGDLNIYNVTATWAPRNYQGDLRKPFGPTFRCDFFALTGSGQELSTSIHKGDIDLTCEPFTDLPLQNYYLMQLIVNSTRCPVDNVSTISWPCQGLEGRVALTYNVGLSGFGASAQYLPNAYITYPNPTSSSKVSVAPFLAVPDISLNKSDAFQGPEIKITQVTQDRISFRYSIPPISTVGGWQVVCSWDANMGQMFSSISGPINQRVFTAVSFVGLSPGTDLKVSGQCTDIDHQVKEYSFTVQTEKPKGPDTPRIMLTGATGNSATMVISNYIPTYTYSVDAGPAKFSITGPTVRLLDLAPSTLYKLKVTATDSFSQSNSSDIFEVKTMSANISISCIKGKITKKVSGIAPKCPAGYRQK